MRRHVLWRLIWIQTVCKGLQNPVPALKGLTHLCLASRKKALANSVDPDETPHDAASHQGLRCLLKGISVRNILNIEINILDIPNFGNKLIQFRRMGESTRHKWVNQTTILVLKLRLISVFIGWVNSTEPN